MANTVFEKELRRQAVYTDFHRAKLPTLLYSQYCIFYNDYRIVLETPTNPGKVEKKTSVDATCYLLDSDVGQSLEVCYHNEEITIEADSFEISWLKHGTLTKKKVYLKTDNLILYVLKSMETKLGYLRHKIIIELEDPDECSRQERNQYMALAYEFSLDIDEKKIRSTRVVENVQHTNNLPIDISQLTGFDSPSTPSTIQSKQNIPTIPITTTKSQSNEVLQFKVDGERGILLFHDNYQTYSNNTISICLNENWNKQICFYLKHLNVVAEYVQKPERLVSIESQEDMEHFKSVPFLQTQITQISQTTQTTTRELQHLDSLLVIVDLAVSNYNALQRYEFIQKIAAHVRRDPNVSKRILFQGYDRDVIRNNCKVDGLILITANDGIIKIKQHPTVDLECVSSLDDCNSKRYDMVDLNGYVYYICPSLNMAHLRSCKIYECILNAEYKVIDVVRLRDDKFHPNSRATVLSNVSCLYPTSCNH